MSQGAPRSLAAERDLHLSPDDFHRLAQLAHAEAGLAMPDAKEPLVYARLVKRLRQLSIDSFGAYIDLLSQPDAGEERSMFVSSMTTNTTRFFREEHHFDLLADSVLPPILAAARRGARVRLWSAGCSSGEEPYSMAITILRLCPQAASYDLKILATDIDVQILAMAREGRFTEAVLSGLPEEARETFFGAPDAQGSREVGPSLRALVTFKPMNLVKPWPVNGPFDVIFCRNVAIYFDAATQDRIWRGFAGTLSPGGYLFIGHSERLSPSVRHQFETVGMTSFRLRGSRDPGGQGKGET
ncbi:protein-glutamate O-methyltransferase [Cereibacter sphaeroides]|uniref:protein-glutamate O-methyltransferase n=1 Tax=Cereibacter sphaeroides TaxID=1063 RepID=UPI001F3A0B79|nr:protein-glutamate O-methyltransferase [Cereibacter sphaeroides]MCE6950374.1 protein-glutamate O-methyltransferase [Cereibacter sphaeroides]MCE6961501.1 protein-glutamate O-methyltransferase [Cereibacter sphaeroides]MCE6967816.1 protein-glutamate O-methyltransferase [Cereibacter sphaeroides]MCE6972596.1 protein-glutamate O-methyltransferase [Cereibacter sphaeroides]